MESCHTEAAHERAEDLPGECARAQSGPGSGRRTSGARRRAVMTSAAAGLVAWAWFVVLHDPVYRQTFPRIFAGAATSAAPPIRDAGVYEAEDPPPGTLLPAAGAGRSVRARAPRHAAGYLLASLGDCSSCTRIDLEKLYRQAHARRIALIAFACGDPDDVRKQAASLAGDGVDVPILPDPGAKLTKVLNGYYGGRLYYFGLDWRLRWLERDWGIDNYLFSTGRFDRIMRNTAP